MALGWIEGFELHGTGTGAATQAGVEAGIAAKWDTSWFSSAGYLAEGRFLGKSVECQGYSGLGFRRQFPDTKTTWIVGFAMKGNTSNGDDILRIFNSLDLETDAAGRIFVKNGSTTLGTSGDSGGEETVFWDGAWHYIELKVVIDAVAGSWELRVDGIESANRDPTITGEWSRPGAIPRILASFGSPTS